MPIRKRQSFQLGRVGGIRGRPRRTVRRRTAWQIGRGFPVTSPRTMVVKLRYALPFDLPLSSTGFAVATYQFRCNSIFDPWVQIGGAQPRATDQYFALYNNATVLSSKLIARFSYDTSATSAHAGECFMTVNDTFSPFVGYTGIQESRFTKIRTINSQKCLGMKMNYNTARFFGRKAGDLLNDKTLSHTSATNPDEEAFFHLGFYTYTNNDQTIYVNGYIDYTVQFWETKIPPQS